MLVRKMAGVGEGGAPDAEGDDVERNDGRHQSLAKEMSDKERNVRCWEGVPGAGERIFYFAAKGTKFTVHPGPSCGR